MRALLLLVTRGRLDDGRPVAEVVRSVACPGLGTGIGRMPSGICARQMRAAAGEVLLGEGRFPGRLGEAMSRHDELSH